MIPFADINFLFIPWSSVSSCLGVGKSNLDDSMSSYFIDIYYQIDGVCLSSDQRKKKKNPHIHMKFHFLIKNNKMQNNMILSQGVWFIQYLIIL